MSNSALSPVDAYALSRHIIGEIVPGDLKLSPLTRMLLQLDATALKTHAMNAGILNAILAANPIGAAPVRPEDTIYVPPLPSYAEPKDKTARDAERVCPWLNDFIAWSTRRSPLTPPLFLEAGGVFLIGMAIARRVVIIPHAKIYPHLYVLWIAETTRFAKSTGLSAVNDLASKAMPHMQLPHTSTPEALLEGMSGKMPENYSQLKPREKSLLDIGTRFSAQRALILDEASSLLGASKKDYMAGLQEFFLRAYDAPETETRSTKQGLMVVHNLALSILGATTPAAMARTVTPDKWEDGEMARYALLYPEGAMAYTEDYGDFEPPPEMVMALKRLHDDLPKPPDPALMLEDDPQLEALTASMTADAMRAYKNYNRAMKDILEDDPDPRLAGNYGRLPTMGMKVALSMASMDWCHTPNRDRVPTITLLHWHRAQSMVEKWRGSLHRLMPALSESLDSRAQSRIERLLVHSPSGLTMRDISRRIGVPTKYIQSAISVLEESGIVLTSDSQNPNGGPKTKVYRHTEVMSAK